jgi:hypothetical protein
MKNNIAIALAILALIISIVSYFKIKELSYSPTVIESGNTEAPMLDGDTSGGLSKAGEGFELANYMTNLQRHANKLWFSGTAQNWELAQFYVHELEESMEKIEQANVYEDGIALSPLVRNLGIKQLENLETAIKNKESKAFDEAYDLLVSNCNNCHNAAKHPFIVIQKPKTPVFDSQIYTPAAL